MKIEISELTFWNLLDYKTNVEKFQNVLDIITVPRFIAVNPFAL